MQSLVVLFAVVAAAVAAPSIGHLTYSLPAAVSHQSRVDVHSSPALVTSVVAQPVVEAPAIYPAAPVYAAPAAAVYSGGSAVTHQSRVDVQTSPAFVTEHVVGPAVVDARSVWAPSVYSTYW